MDEDKSRNILTLAIRERSALFAAYMPFLKNGGLFIATSKSYQLGDEIFLLLSLLEERERLPVPARVAWITPKGAQGNRAQGIGVEFAAADNGQTRTRIENLLTGLKDVDKPKHTM